MYHDGDKLQLKNTTDKTTTLNIKSPLLLCDPAWKLTITVEAARFLWITFTTFLNKLHIFWRRFVAAAEISPRFYQHSEKRSHNT